MYNHILFVSPLPSDPPVLVFSSLFPQVSNPLFSDKQNLGWTFGVDFMVAINLTDLG